MTNINNEAVTVFLDDEFFNWSEVVIDEPITRSFTKGGSCAEWVTSDVYIPGPNGEKRSIYIELAPQNFWGVSPIYSFGISRENQNSDNIEGFQIAYPVTSISSINNPTQNEVATMSNLNQMWNITCEAMEKFCSVKGKENLKVPAPTYSAYGTAKADEDWSYAVKPIYDHPNTVDKNTGNKIKDTSKPMRMYIKLFTQGKGKSLKCHSRIYGPGDKLTSPYKYISTRGDGHPIIKWDGIFWGAHGRNSYGASLRLRLSEMNFTPSTYSSDISKFRMLPPNKSAAVVIDEVFDDDEDVLELDY